jgi:hypothetical protein
LVEAVYSPKTHRSRRPILLADEELKRLTEFRRRTGRAGEDDWLFLNRFGTGPIHSDKALETLQSAAKRVGVSCGIWHLLRHWHTTAPHNDEGGAGSTGARRCPYNHEHYVHPIWGAERQAADAVSRHF